MMVASRRFVGCYANSICENAPPIFKISPRLSASAANFSTNPDNVAAIADIAGGHVRQIPAYR